MTLKEFIAIGQCYGLLLQRKGTDIIIPTEGIVISNGIKPEERESPDTMCLDCDETLPIIRDMSSLGKECIQADYNDGKPFIPIVELAKRAMEELGEKCEDNGRIYSDTNRVSIFMNDWYFGVQSSIQGTDIFLFDNEKLGRVIDSFGFYLQLLKWHFYPNIPVGEEVVLITDNFNPYK